jgi:hypothetical protein
VALQVTARLSFLLFWPAYAAGGWRHCLDQLSSPSNGARGNSARICIGAPRSLALVAWLTQIGASPPLETFVMFGIAVLWTYFLALFSIGRLHQALRSWTWWILRVAGLYYIAYAFALDFLKHPQLAVSSTW